MDEYNEMTPRDLNIRSEVFSSQKNMEQEDKLTIAYLTALWQRVETLEPLDLILKRIKENQQQKQMSDFEMLLKVQQLNAAMGGSVN